MQYCTEYGRIWRRSGKDVLYLPDFRLRVIQTLFAAVLFAVGIEFAGNAVFIIADMYKGVGEAAEKYITASVALIQYIAIVPLIYGINILGCNFMRNGNAYVSCVFASYAKLPRVIAVSTVRVLPMVAGAAFVYLCLRLRDTVSSFAAVQRYAALKFALYGAIFIACIAVLTLLAAFRIRTFFMPAYAFGMKMTFFGAFKSSFTATAGKTWEIIRFVMLYILRLIPGILTLGVLLAVQTIPGFVADYNVFADLSLEREYKNE